MVDSHKGKLTLSYNRTLLSLVSPTPGIVWVGLSRPDQPDGAIIPILCHMVYERKGEGHSGAGSSEIMQANSPWSHGTTYLPQESGKGHTGCESKQALAK